MKRSILLWITPFLMIGAMLTACSGTASESLTGTWKLSSYGSPANPTPAVKDVETSLTFETDGKLNGTVGCNGFSGDYKVDGDTITFCAIASTMMACADPIAQQEGAAFSVLNNSATFKIDGSTLTITSADGNSAVVFVRN